MSGEVIPNGKESLRSSDRLTAALLLNGKEPAQLQDRLTAEPVQNGKETTQPESRLTAEPVQNGKETTQPADRLSAEPVQNGKETIQVLDRLSGEVILNGKEPSQLATSEVILNGKDIITPRIEDRLSSDNALPNGQTTEDPVPTSHRLALPNGPETTEDRLLANGMENLQIEERLGNGGSSSSSEEIEDRLSVVANAEETLRRREEIEARLSGNKLLLNGDDKQQQQQQQLCHAASTTTDDLCDCEDCKWKKRDLTAEDLQEMMKLKRLGMDLRRYIRYTFNWFMETSGFSTNPSSSPLPQPDLDSIENFVELRESVVL